MKKKKTWLYGLLVLLALGTAAVGGVGYLFFAPQFHPKHTVYVLVDGDDTSDSVQYKLKSVGHGQNLLGMEWAVLYKQYGQHLRTGRYAIDPGDNVYEVFSRLFLGHQTPMKLVVGNPRTVPQLVAHIGQQLMVDSIDIASQLADTTLLAQMGYDEQTLPALFVPDTYEIYWNISARQFVNRMQQEHNRYWNQTRLARATAIGLSATEVATLASIVEEESNKKDERPLIAGLYINRLQKGMPLQADPTIKFALHNFGLRRITSADLHVDSPYNTYTHTGLPPGPIRIASKQAMESVLNYTHHNYIYMCAREDFSGYHNFASNYADHQANARKYWKALNERKIFR
jgi:UPF0755 protein